MEDLPKEIKPSRTIKEKGNMFKFRPKEVEKRMLQREEAKAGTQIKMRTKGSSAH